MIAAAFGAMARTCVRRPKTALALGLLLAAVSLGLAAVRLTLKTSNLDLVDPRLPQVAAFRSFAARFGTPNMLVVALEGDDEDRLRAAVDRVCETVRGGPGVRAVLGRLPYEPELLAALGSDPYFATRDRRMFFVFVQPDDPHSRADTIDPFVRGVRAALARSDLPTMGVRAGLTGLPQYALDDRDVIQRDISRLSGLSFVAVLALFALGFGAFSRPLMGMGILALTAAWVLGLAALWPGHLTLVSAFFFSALFGLGIDYGIHVVDRMEERLAEGRPIAEAAEAAVRSLAPGLFTGSITTACAFYTLTASSFRGFQELGFLGGTGILLALLSMTTLLPAALVLGPRGPGRARRLAERRTGRLLVRLQHPALAWALGLASVLVLARGIPTFDADYLDLQPKDSEAARLEREMVQRSDVSPVFAAFTAASEGEAKALADRLRLDDTVGAVRSFADLAPLEGLTTTDFAGRAAFRSMFVSADGLWAVYAYPAGNVWEPETEAAFLAHMRAIDPAVTGMPVLGRFMIDLSRRALLTTALLSAFVVVGAVLLDLRRPAWAALAILPTALGSAAMLGVMKLLGIPFNPINVMALPVIIGTAEDGGVHTVHRFLEEKGDLVRTMAGTGRALLFCSLTTIAGFASLAFTSHRGLASFALALTLGVTTSLLLSLFVLPRLLAWVGAR